MSNQILQIIPTPPNSSDGIGDYALLLATQLLKDAQINTQFLVFRSDINVEPVINGFPAMQLPAHNPEAFFSAVQVDIQAVVVHFSSYPYFDTSLKGAFGIGTPFWLIDALQEVISSRKLKLIVMFHELPKLHWKQIYFFNYLNPIHSLVSRRLATIANTVLASSTKYQSILSKWLGKNVVKISIFSNMGEPKSVPLLRNRKRRLVIFGGSSRCRIYKNNLNGLIQACRALGIEQICDVGPPMNLPKSLILDIDFVEMGFRPQAEISELLLTSIAGCVDYSPFPGDLGKSGVFAAYCAHGLVPILTRYNPSEADGLYINQHYLALGAELDDLDLAELQMVADNAHQWYMTHALKVTAQVFSSHILGSVSQAYSV
jgi:hypothetical protein